MQIFQALLVACVLFLCIYLIYLVFVGGGVEAGARVQGGLSCPSAPHPEARDEELTFVNTYRIIILT